MSPAIPLHWRVTLKYLDAQGYKVAKAQPVDMFPWTAHVECIIMMTYCGSEDK